MLATSAVAPSKPAPRPQSTSTSDRRDHKRTRSLPRRLSLSASCPHLPYLAAGTSSPPAVTSALAFGSTTPTTTTAYSWRPRTRQDDGYSSSADPRRMSSGFPWEVRASSGRMSPAVEFTEYLARQNRPSTPPALHHSASDPVWNRSSRSSTKSSLKLELPPPRIDGPFGSRLDVQSNDRHQGRFMGHSLLNFAYPATPDIGMNNVPVIRQDENAARGGGGAHVVGHAAGGAVTQNLLNAPGTRMRGGLNLLTPPDDNGVIDWRQNHVSSLDAHDVSLGPRRKEEEARMQPRTSDEIKMMPGESADASGQSSSTTATATSESGQTGTKPEKDERDSSDEMVDEDWMGSALAALVGANLPESTTEESIRILSYTLPCPLPASEMEMEACRNGKLPASATAAPSVAAAAGEQLSPSIMDRCTSRPSRRRRSSVPTTTQVHCSEGMTSALPSVTAAIQQKYASQGSGRVYIHITHALDPRTALFNRLPSTPPLTGGPGSAGNTPGMEMQGGYFSPSVFNAIVIASPSQPSTPTSGIPPMHLPSSMPSPNPILPPSSLHLTLLERYIPPASPADDRDMFQTRSSPLVDRLFELSPHGGSLLFIYPTKTGAATFEREYLGPVLDPLLRKLMVLYMLRDDLLWRIRNMAASSAMSEYSDLFEKVRKFCRLVSKGGPGSGKNVPQIPLKIVFATRACVPLNELSWREWWTQQEQQRIRDMVKDHFARMTPAAPVMNSSGSSNSSFGSGYGVPGDLAREVLDGVRAPNVRPSSRGMGEAVLASSMSGTGSVGGANGYAGVGSAGVTMGTTGLDGLAGGVPDGRRGVEVGVFILRRGVRQAR